MDWLQNEIVRQVLAGAIAGAIGAARADRMAFKSWNSWRDIAAYDWSVATWRWFQGGVLGAFGVPAADQVVTTVTGWLF